ncbi:MAG: hypothetical protein M0C28_32065 [Candidatus Moduliflexus flocculans]|nr:hypothetical protein [Candidatus Moduliflexus flocculans]
MSTGKPGAGETIRRRDVAEPAVIDGACLDILDERVPVAKIRVRDHRFAESDHIDRLAEITAPLPDLA